MSNLLAFLNALLLLVSILFSGCQENENSSFSANKDANAWMEHPPIQYGPEVVDIEGNTYPTVVIGKQTWMAKDLITTTSFCNNQDSLVFTNGIERGPYVKFSDTTVYRYAYYNNRLDSIAGVLYSYKVIRDCPLCPEGYRIPTKADWEELVDELGGASEAGEKLKINGSSGLDLCICGWIDFYGSVYRGRAGWWWTSDLDSTLQKAHTFSPQPQWVHFNPI